MWTNHYDQDAFAKAEQFLRECEDAYILIHQSPDGDCIGSGYSLQAVLHQLGKRAKVLCADEIPAKYNYMKADVPEENFEPKCIITVDVADAKLLGCYEEMYGNKVDFCIDHHISNKHYAKQTLIISEASAACEVLYKLYTEMGIAFTEQIAKCLYTGMATDTGCFKFDNVTADTMRFTAEIMEQFPDIRYGMINRIMFDVKTPERMKAECAMIQAMEYYLDGRCAVICVTKELCERTGMNPEDTDGMANLPIQPEGVEVGITMREKDDNLWKISLRSADSVNVSAIAQTLGGGGHIKAAGCALTGTLSEVRTQLLEAVRKGLEQA